MVLPRLAVSFADSMVSSSSACSQMRARRALAAFLTGLRFLGCRRGYWEFVSCGSLATTTY
eukprot:7757050-Lingulodinium_polyedra.AAC.1